MADSRIRVAGVLMTVTLIATGCGWFGTDKALHRVGPQPRYSEIWSADPSIDLFDRGAELVRAAVEAATYTRFAGLRQTFPGFEDAIDTERQRRRGSYVDLISPRGRASLGLPRTDFNHITELSVSDSYLSAIVCNYVIFDSPQPDYDPGPGVVAIKVRLSNPSKDPGQPGTPDRRREVADSPGGYVPDWNVFGPWRVEELDLEYERLPDGCASWFQARYPMSVRRGENDMSAPLGTIAPTMPVGIHYPEWIGPSEG